MKKYFQGAGILKKNLLFTVRFSPVSGGRGGEYTFSRCTKFLASYPGLPSQLFSQPWQKNTLLATAAKKAVREGLGTRLPNFPEGGGLIIHFLEQIPEPSLIRGGGGGGTNINWNIAQ